MEGKQCSMSFEDIWGSICNEIGVAEIFLRPPLLHMYSFTQLITAQDNPEHPETLIILCISVLQSLQYNCGPFLPASYYMIGQFCPPSYCSLNLNIEFCF